MAMNKWVKRKWLRALKSGEYTKGQGTLGRKWLDEYCCLGVLVCEMAPEFIQSTPNWIEVGTNSNFLPDDLAIMWGLDKATQSQLARINDREKTFAPIIAYIENNL